MRRLYLAVTDNGRHPEDLYLIAAAVLVIFAGLRGWLD